jgi:hypothetical protein
VRTTRRIVWLLPALLAIACAPSAGTLKGTAAPGSAVPRVELPHGHQQMVFDWEYDEGEVGARGDGVVRTAYPDSARLDLFVRGGFASGRALLIGDEIRLPNMQLIRRYLPPPPLLWAAFGRVAVPPSRDTVVRVAGDTVRADIGTWRLMFVQRDLRSVERLSDGKIAEFVTRDAAGNVRYLSYSPRRELRLKMTKRDSVPPFPPEEWRLEG